MGRRHPLTETGLHQDHERMWVHVWGQAREAGYTGADLEKLGAAIRSGVLWLTTQPLSPGKLNQHLPDLLAQAQALDGSPSAERGGRPGAQADPAVASERARERGRREEREHAEKMAKARSLKPAEPETVTAILAKLKEKTQ